MHTVPETQQEWRLNSESAKAQPRCEEPVSREAQGGDYHCWCWSDGWGPPERAVIFQYFLLVPHYASLFLPVALKHNSLTDRLSRKTRQWAVEWVGLRSHQGIDGHLKGKGQAFMGYPQLALVKTFFLLSAKPQWVQNGQSVAWTADLSLVLWSLSCAHIESLELLRFSQGFALPVGLFLGQGVILSFQGLLQSSLRTFWHLGWEGGWELWRHTVIFTLWASPDGFYIKASLCSLFFIFNKHQGDQDDLAWRGRCSQELRAQGTCNQESYSFKLKILSMILVQFSTP